MLSTFGGNNELVDFLRQVKKDPTTHVVIGNSAGDADSIVSALTHAYSAYMIDSASSEKKRFTPVVSIAQRDLETTRPETMLLLKWAGISTTDLLYVDDPIVQDQATTVTLVDHNHLQTEGYKHCIVIEIIDHHKDDGMHTDCPTRRIAYANGKVLTASTCTVVAESLMNENVATHSSLATLLLGVILLDSVNLSDEAGKVTDRDRDAVSFLVQNTNWTQSNLPFNCRKADSTTPDLSKLFETLQQAKFDRDFWTALSIREALRLDFKSFQDNTFGISTVLIAWEDFKQKKNLIGELKSFLDEIKTQLLIVMFGCQDTDGVLKRELLIYSSDNAYHKKVADFLVAKDLDLHPIEIQDDELLVFSQGNAKASRKQVAPLIGEFYEH